LKSLILVLFFFISTCPDFAKTALAFSLPGRKTFLPPAPSGRCGRIETLSALRDGNGVPLFDFYSQRERGRDRFLELIEDSFFLIIGRGLRTLTLTPFFTTTSAGLVVVFLKLLQSRFPNRSRASGVGGGWFFSLLRGSKVGAVSK